MAVTQIVTRLIKDLAITTAKLAANAVTLGKLGALTTKGDLLVYDTVHNRLAVGSDGQVLTADSASSPGVKWATPSVGGATFVFGETPSGTVNGSNDTFSIAHTPIAATERIYVNGMRMKSGAGNDYTISTSTITFLTGAIPQTGDVLQADYTY